MKIRKPKRRRVQVRGLDPTWLDNTDWTGYWILEESGAWWAEGFLDSDGMPHFVKTRQIEQWLDQKLVIEVDPA